ncbi:helveticin J family class III bacteriocin [Secundilactobacillus yichangensis]|uniref:helveticin J family class III bacteriocin n=1 Tax=Secundilactobacillus yichangensis TaxID=2799580 RepID=UPI0019444010|nr:helveticin J family class III bacteriocin [Secundilactobacillus yichangensis]
MATATKAYTLINLPINSSGHQSVVQKTYVGTNNIYCLQQFGTDTYISKASIAGGQTTVDFSQGETMVLTNTGHAQTLDWYQHDGKDYFLVATYPKANETTQEWATQLARVQFQSGRTIDPATLTGLSWLDHANTTGSDFETLLRVEAAISTSREYLLIMGIRTGDHHAQLTYYNLEGLNNVLDSVEASGAYAVQCNDARITAQAIDTWQTSSSIYGLMQVNNSVQGMDFSDGQAVYFSSGGLGQTPTVVKVAWKSTNFRPVSFSGDWGAYHETEGIQVKDTLYLGISTHLNNDTGSGNYTTGNYVYTVDKGNW